MSGLCAIVFSADSSEGSDASGELQAHVNALMHGVAARGPHARAVWLDRSIAIGHHLLKEVPEAQTEAQPLHSHDGRYVIAFDGRIDNRDELAIDLPAPQRPQRGAPDVAYALAAHIAWGREAAPKLLGDFAYVIWDRRDRVLHAARDPLAGRPLYWVKTRHLLALCSSDDALLALPDVSSAPNPSKLVDVIARADTERNRFSSWYRDVNTLLPGYRLHAGRDFAVRCEAFIADQCVEVASFANMDAVVEALTIPLQQAVLSRLRSFGPAAMLLSGGIDSGSIIATASSLLSRAGKPPIQTYSLLSDDADQCVESQLIQSAIDHFSCAATTLRPKDFSDIDWTHLADFIWRDAHPIDNSLCYQAPLYRAASAAGCTSLLNAVGGDVVTGVGDFPASHLIRAGQWADAWQLCRDLAQNNTYLQDKTPLELFLRSARRALPSPRSDALRAVRNLARFGTNLSSLSACSERLIALAAIHSNREPTAAVQTLRIWDAARREYHSLEWVAHGQVGYDRVAGRYGMVARDVWSDLRLIRFYLSIPLRFRMAEGFTKAPVRAFIERSGANVIARSTAKAHTGAGLVEAFLARAPRANALDALSPYLREADATAAEYGYFVGAWLERSARHTAQNDATA